MARLIDADAVDYENIMCSQSQLHWLNAIIEKQPTVDAVEVVHGRWIPYLDGDSIMPERYYRCSECCDRGWRREWPYCPNCGADMKSKGD